MITDLLVSILNAFDGIYTSFGLTAKISELIFDLTAYQDYITDFKYYFSAVYFIFGKALVTYVVGVCVIVLLIRITTAIINIVWP